MENMLEVPFISTNDWLRVEKLKSFKILDSQPEAPFNYIAALAAKQFKTPIALISLVDKYRVWYKAAIGLNNIQEVPRSESLCSMVILQETVTVYEDALKEPCLLANPFVAGDFGLRFYAGAPIKTTDGYRIGAVCIIDSKPRTFSEAEQKELQNLADMAMEEITLRL
ncbi:GAF domain-containing protein [Adhaeribacter aquaticus]|uniref:GAF domain-containing protein n=1 Tax=Adhaeribacter aquaticus TaxID=299567 RepID=UPI00047D70FF|nr:GAF domain-containing protein [Adhaeribacter aquaticus]